MAAGPTEEEFAKWLTPQQALNCLPGSWSYDTKVRWIDRRLESGLIRSAASASRGKSQQTATVALAAVPPQLWTQFACLAEHDFWKTGDVTFYSSTTGYDRQWSGTLHDVRFDPAGFQDAVPPEGGLASASTQDAEKPTVSRAELAKWHEVFKGVHPEAAEALALQSAAAMFPDKHVPRQYVRDLRGPQKRGKPPARR